jgi:predicted deacetylase
VRRTVDVTASRLVVSVSGLGGAPLAATGWLATELDRRSVPLSLLVTPPRLAAAPHVAEWVRTRVQRGDAPVLRGLERLAGRPRPDRWLAGMAVLPAHETRLQLIAARAALAQLDLTVDAYAPPGWLVPPGTLDVLRRDGFRACAELRGVRDLATGALVPGRVLGPGSAPWQGRTEPWWCRAMVLGAARAARLGRLVRLAVPAFGLSRPGIAAALIDAVDIALHHGAEPVTYPALARPVLPIQRTASTPRTAPRAVAR